MRAIHDAACRCEYLVRWLGFELVRAPSPSATSSFLMLKPMPPYEEFASTCGPIVHTIVSLPPTTITSPPLSTFVASPPVFLYRVVLLGIVIRSCIHTLYQPELFRQLIGV